MHQRIFGGIRFLTALLLLTELLSMPLVSLSGSTPALNEGGLSQDQRVVQALSRLTFGARPGDFDRVKKMGVDAFIEEQLNPDSIDDTALFKRLEKLPTLNLATPTLAEQYNPPKPPPTPTPAATPAKTVATDVKTAASDVKASAAGEAMKSAVIPGATPAPQTQPPPNAKPVPTPAPKNPYMVVTELQRAKLLRAVYSERQLYEVIVDFWENHFSIFANKDADRWMLTSFDRDSIRPFSMGRFRDLLGATAHSPAMLFYLDNWQSSMLHEYPATKDKPARKTGGINENYARELMELHTLGVDGGYSQKDVQEVARCFTGWTIRKPNEEGVFVYNPAAHDNGEKIVLGVKIPAGGGIADGERVLDILAKSPATARFITTKMARRFMGDVPPEAVIDRAVKTFLATDGSISETLRSIVSSPEFFGTATFQSKIKSPFEYVASALRITNAETDAHRPILDWIGRMGQPVYGRITPDGYPDVSREWLSNNDLLARFNFATALALNTVKGTTIDAAKVLSRESDPDKAANETIRVVLMGQASERTRKSLKDLARETSRTAVQSPPPAAAMLTARSAEERTKALTGQLVALALGTPEFQRK
jgi:uncharacterized protein (DUF1800 family)